MEYIYTSTPEHKVYLPALHVSIPVWELPALNSNFSPIVFKRCFFPNKNDVTWKEKWTEVAKHSVWETDTCRAAVWAAGWLQRVYWLVNLGLGVLTCLGKTILLFREQRLLTALRVTWPSVGDCTSCPSSVTKE